MSVIITERIIGCAFEVHNTLGVGFLEKVYENALCVELRNAGIPFTQQHRTEVLYKGITVGEYFPDLMVENSCIVELKAMKTMDRCHQAQILNYLRATGIKTALLLNFGMPRLEIKRFSM